MHTINFLYLRTASKFSARAMEKEQNIVLFSFSITQVKRRIGAEFVIVKNLNIAKEKPTSPLTRERGRYLVFRERDPDYYPTPMGVRLGVGMLA